MAVVATVTLAFIMIGEINTLAPIVTMPYLLTYACIDYSYFALAQIFDVQHQREQRFHQPVHQTHEIDSDLDHLFPERIRHKTLKVTNHISSKINFNNYYFMCFNRVNRIPNHLVHLMSQIM